ncbi:hypothetical protein HIM_01404 [Hirsutella minnesotensis 3608]|nr:hypothetical protein HIM_01404 [Hirsutella minnesotensis 3608]
MADKKYFHVGGMFMKRTLRHHEWQTRPDGRIIIPAASIPQRWKTDAAVQQYLRETTNIPLPPFAYTFEDDGALYFCAGFVEGVSMRQLKRDEKAVVIRELEKHVTTLRCLRSDRPGVPGESLMCPPQRVVGSGWKADSCWRPRKDNGEYVFCHNDLAQQNVIVDPLTLKIKAIIDWEFGGFWPEWLERPFWRGPSLDREDDVERCREWLLENCDEVVMPGLEY